MRTNLIQAVLATIVCMQLTGCGTIPRYEDKGGRYVEAIYIGGGLPWEPPRIRSGLCYKYSDFWHSTIWPKTYNIIVTNDVAIFSGGKAYEPPYPDEPLATGWRLFAVIAPELPLDITDEVVWRSAKQSNEDLTIVLKNPDLLKKVEIGVIDQTNCVLEFGVYIRDTTNGVVHLEMNQIPDIMREVKEKGVVRKDRVEHTAYIEKVFTPEVRK
jgi:hypothetical protein